MKRPPTPKPVQRTIRFYAGARCVKTHRQRITLRQSYKEIGEERLFTRGDTTTMKRRFGHFARIEVTWSAVQSLLTPTTHITGVDIHAAQQVARHGGIL